MIKIQVDKLIKIIKLFNQQMMKLMSLTFLTILAYLFKLTTSFTFASIVVQPDSKIINTVSRYRFQYDRTKDDNLDPTPYDSIPIMPSDTTTVTFPNTYTLSSVTCSISVNGGTPFTLSSCITSGYKVIASGIVNTNTFISSIILWVHNILNPSPAFTTDNFYGTIGSDTTGIGFYASVVTLEPAQFLSCSITFSPNIVNSTGNMILTMVPTNAIPSTGSIQIQFPSSLRWTNDLSSTNFLPISSSMVCTNVSNNVKSTFPCGSTSQNIVTASSLFNSQVSTTFSLSINNFLSPPTGQPSDSIRITSYTSGSRLDTCSAFVSNLSPKPMTSLSISSSNNTSIIVNRQYNLRFTMTLSDTIAQTDTIVINFPTGTQLAFSTSTVSSNFSIFPGNATYDSNNLNLNLFMQNQNRTFGAGVVLIVSIGTYTAPPSIFPTGTFTLTFFQNNFPKIIGTSTLSASASTLSGTVSMISSIINTNTSYIFTLTTMDPLSSTGRIKIIFPNTITIVTSAATCAQLTGTGLSLTASCLYNSIQNSITFQNLASGTANIPAQTMTITVNGLRNPTSIAPTGAFSILTYFQNTDSHLVATGTVQGITATRGFINPNRFLVTSSSYVVNQPLVTYFYQLSVTNIIPVGGYFLVYIPPQIILPSTLNGQCSININLTSYVPTMCTSVVNGSGNIINFTNPFMVDANTGTVFIVRISSIFTNPSSTRPTSSFAVYTFHSNGFAIDSVDSLVSIQMNATDSFSQISILRSSHKNYQTNIYTFTLRQRSPFQSSSVVVITFPSVITVLTPSCSMSSPTTTSLTCTYSNSILRINLPSINYSSLTIITFIVTNIRNPPSYAPPGPFYFQTKTFNQQYSYSNGFSTNTLNNNIPTSFQTLTYKFTPMAYGEQGSLLITFNPSTSAAVPSQTKLTLANSFIIEGLSCNSFIDFIGSCTISPANTVVVTGAFTAAPMTFSVTGFRTPFSAVTDYSTIVSSDTGGFKIDESNNQILFTIQCNMPCRTCSATNKNSCQSCYSNTLISLFIYYDSTLKNCYQQCIAGKYSISLNSTTHICLSCNQNCLTCVGNSTFCLLCNTTSTWKYLYINTTQNTRQCYSQCPITYFPDFSINPTICKICQSPCRQCTSLNNCTSCVSGFFFYQNQCLTACPTGLAIANSLTNNCDFCASSCLTCQGTIITCTSCNQSLLIYLSQCRTSCPTPLVPQNGTCGPCDPNSNCKTCSNNPFNCTSCDTNSTNAYLLNNLCLSSCPETFYMNIGAGLCSLCSNVPNLNCRNCSSFSTCNTCDIGFVLYLRTCLNYVPNGFVNVSGIAIPCSGDCLTCSIVPSNCTSCTNLSYFNYQCLNNCPSGYVSISKICQPCQFPCRTCITKVDTCTSCNNTNLITSLYYLNFECIQNCPDGMYPTQTNYSCLPCQSPCAFCTSITICLTCLNGFFLSNTTCVTQCVPGFTGINQICQACLGNCATCINSTTLCTSCKSNTYLLSATNTCVTSCGTGLYIDYLTQTCISCAPPCKTCTNTSDTCLSCTLGILYNNQCITQCPPKYFIQSGQCNLCPINCSSCFSLINCTGCTQNFVLYNGFCITQCPSTHAVIINSVCTLCSTSKCHKCSSADFCLNCESGYSLYNGACLAQCPSGFQNNGTHCLDTNQQVLTTKSAPFPVPFSIATAVILIACVMSKLQFQHTFMSGALYSLIGIVQLGALAYFLYLQFSQFYFITPLPFYVGGASSVYLYLLNFLALIIQNYSLCLDRDFKIWYNSPLHKIATIIVNIISTLFNHKFRNILFCKLFTFDIFTARLQTTSKFKVLNVFSFLSLLHSGGAIFAAVVAINSAQAFSQLFYACIDVIVATGINTILAFLNIMKSSDFFYQKTPDGFELKKIIDVNDNDCYYQSKIQPEGKAAQDQEGFTTNIYRVQAGMGFNTNQLLKIRDSFEEKDYSFGSLIEKNMEEISVQAVQQLNQAVNEQQGFSSLLINSTDKSKVMKNNMIGQSQIQIQASPIIQKSLQQRLFNIQNNKERIRKDVTKDLKKNYLLSQQSNSQDYNKLKLQKDRKKIYDSSQEQSKLQINKNFLYRPHFRSKDNFTEAPKVNKFQNQNQKDDQYKPLQLIERSDKIIKEFVAPTGNLRQKNSPVLQQQQYLDQITQNIVFEEIQQKKQINKRIGSYQNSSQQINQAIQPNQDIKQQQKELQQQVFAKQQTIKRIKKQIQNKEKTNNYMKNSNNQILEAGRFYRKGVMVTNQEHQRAAYIQQQKSKSLSKQEIENQLKDSQEQNYILIENHQNQLIFEQQDIQNNFIQQNEQYKITISKPQNSSMKILQPEQLQGPMKILQAEEPTSANQLVSNFKHISDKQSNKQQSTERNLIYVNELERSIDQQSDDIYEQPKGYNKSQPQIKRKHERKEEKPQLKNNKPIQQETKTKPYATLQADTKKQQNLPKVSPIKNVKRFVFENEQKNIYSQSGQDDIAVNRYGRANFIAPFQTDKQQTQFKTVGQQEGIKILIPRTLPVSGKSKDGFSSQENRQKPPINSFSTRLAQKNEDLRKSKYDMEFGLPDREDPYIQESDSVDMKNMTRNQPDKQVNLAQKYDQLQQYYQQTGKRNSKSKEKSKKKQSISQLQAEKIYLQRQELKKWK